MRRSQSLSSSSSGLRCFAALARASRLASRASLNWFLRRLLISTSTFRRSNRGPCALSHGRPSSPTPRNRGHGISYAGALPPCPGSRCRISPWPLRCSFRSNVHQHRGLLLVVRYQTLEDDPVTLGLALVVLSPLSLELPVAFGVVALDALLPKLLAGPMPLFGCAMVVASLYKAIEFMLDRFAAAYVHLTLLLPFHCPRTRGQAQRPLAGSGYCYRPRPRPYIGIGTQGR